MISHAHEAKVTRQTLIFAVLGALIVGFLGGVAYSVYRSPQVQEAGQTDQRGGQAQRAALIAQLEEATRNTPNNAQAWIELGHAYFDGNQPQQAINAYTQALKLEPGAQNVRTDLGVMYHQAGQHEQAIKMFDQVLLDNPAHEQARFNKGVVLFTGLNNPAAALRQWKMLLQHHPEALAPTGQRVDALVRELEQQHPTEQLAPK